MTDTALTSRSIVAQPSDPLRYLLPQEDRVLLELRSNDQVTVRSLASLLKCSRGTMYRRFAALQKRIGHPWASVIAHRSGELSLLHRQIAIRRFIWGQTRTEICHALGLHPERLRYILDEVETWCRHRQFTRDQ